jgi:hypothetical protein
MEVMRTHGFSRTTAYDNFHAVIEAINSHPALATEYSGSIVDLKKKQKKI